MQKKIFLSPIKKSSRTHAKNDKDNKSKNEKKNIFSKNTKKSCHLISR